MSQPTNYQFEIPKEHEAGRPQPAVDSESLPEPVMPERHLSRPEQNIPQGASVALHPQSSSLPSVMSISTPAPQTTQMPQAVSTTLNADDIDVIEKEWVEKAKKLLAETVDDPYVGAQQITLLKADYMKKRFNRELKIPEVPGSLS